MAFYYFAKKILRMSDTEFWESTPAKLFALLDYHNKVENPDKREVEKPPAQKMTMQDFLSWGGKIK